MEIKTEPIEEYNFFVANTDNIKSETVDIKQEIDLDVGFIGNAKKLEQHKTAGTFMNNQQCNDAVFNYITANEHAKSFFEQKKKSQMETHMHLQCNKCHYKTTQRPYLVKHMRSHCEEKRYKCNQCDYSSKYGNSLARHSLIHSRENPFKCELCKYKCFRRDHLVRHYRSHSGEKPFECDLCEYKCRQRGNLAQHKLTHFKAKSYKCTKCDHKTIRKGDLLMHMQIHSGVGENLPWGDFK